MRDPLNPRAGVPDRVRMREILSNVVDGAHRSLGGIGFGDSPAIRRGSFEVKDLLLRELCSTRTNCKIAYQLA